MQMSDEGRKRLTAREGVRLRAYQDSVGVWTIGIGHTSAAGPPHVTPELTITREECDAIFKRDLAQYEAAVNRAVRVPLAQHQFDALVSFCFNIGTGGFARSSVVKCLNAGDMECAAAAFMMWKKPKEIIGRRQSEVAQFRTPYNGAAAAPKPLPVPSAKPTTAQDKKEGTGIVVGGGGITAFLYWLWGSWAFKVALLLLIAAAVYWLVARPIVRRMAALDDLDTSPLGRLRLALKGIKTKLFAWLLGIAGLALPVLSWVAEIGDLSAFLPDIAGVPGSIYQYGILALIGMAVNKLRNATTTPVGTTDLALVPASEAPPLAPDATFGGPLGSGMQPTPLPDFLAPKRPRPRRRAKRKKKARAK